MTTLTRAVLKLLRRALGRDHRSAQPLVSAANRLVNSRIMEFASTISPRNLLIHSWFTQASQGDSEVTVDSGKIQASSRL